MLKEIERIGYIFKGAIAKAVYFFISLICIDIVPLYLCVIQMTVTFTPDHIIAAQFAVSQLIQSQEWMDCFWSEKVHYLPAVSLGRRRGGGTLLNRCGGLAHWREAPLLGAQGAAVEASLVLMVLRHGGHQSALWSFLSTGTHRLGTSSKTSSHLQPAAHLKHKGQEVILQHSFSLPCSICRSPFIKESRAELQHLNLSI